jgi:hypothetical protein
LIITYEGKAYDFDLADMTIKQAMKVEKHIGGPMDKFEKGIASGDLACFQALGWLILHGGDDTPVADVDFKISRLSQAFAEAVQAEAEEEAAKADGQVPIGAASNGRKSSPVSSPSA